MTYTETVCRKRGCVEPVTSPQSTQGFCSVCYLRSYFYNEPLPSDKECKEVVDSFKEGVIKAHKGCKRWKANLCNRNCDVCALTKYVVGWEIPEDKGEL